MLNDLVDDIDTGKILLNDKEEIMKAIGISDKIKSQIDIVENTLKYSYFLRENIDKVKGNYERLQVITSDVYEIMACCKLDEIKRYISEISFDKVNRYISFFKNDFKDERIGIRSHRIQLPQNPFSDCLNGMKLYRENTTDRNQVVALNGLMEKIKACNNYAMEIEKNSNDMVEYDVCDEYPDFYENKLGAYEILMGNLPEVFDASIEDIERTEYSLEDLADELKMVETIVEEYAQ